MPELLSVFFWWGLISFLGALAFPFTFWLFRRFWDGGWALAKILGLVLLTYWTWIVGSLRILPFGPLSLWLGVGLLGWFSFQVFMRSIEPIRTFVRDHLSLILFEELLFGVGLLGWAWIRAHQPDIEGLEKFMDFGFVNSILRSRWFPPLDMWLSGNTINYYYFGHLVTAVLTKLSGFPSFRTYNLMIAALFSLTLVSSFSIGGALTRTFLRIRDAKSSRVLVFLGAIISAVTLTLAGNLHTIITVVNKGASSYWYPDATRYIPFTIHEFPLYSFVVADLHGHVSNIPFVLLMVGLIFSFGIELSLKRFSLPFSSFLLRLLAIGLTTAVLFMTNSLDAPIYFLLFIVALVSSGPRLSFLRRSASIIFVSFYVVLISAFLFSLPFSLRFHPFAQGIALVTTRSSPRQLGVLWGFFLLVAFVFLSSFIRHPNRYFPDRPSGPARRFLLSLLGVSLILVVLPEVIYIKDIYVAEYYRANTMFKLAYQAFIMMALVTGPVFSGLLWNLWTARGRGLRFSLLAVVFVFLFGLGSVVSYPYFAIRSYYSSLKHFRGLDGLAWLSAKYPNDAQAIDWLRENVEGQPVILEAVGESYTNFARVSANTGLPTILGWRVHEWLWRGSFDEAGLRTNVVSTMYTSVDSLEVCRLIDRYDVDYVFVGTLERSQYPTLSEAVFERLGTSVFTSGDTRVYRIRKPCRSLSFHLHRA